MRIQSPREEMLRRCNSHDFFLRLILQLLLKSLTLLVMFETDILEFYDFLFRIVNLILYWLDHILKVLGLLIHEIPHLLKLRFILYHFKRSRIWLGWVLNPIDALLKKVVLLAEFEVHDLENSLDSGLLTCYPLNVNVGVALQGGTDIFRLRVYFML